MQNIPTKNTGDNLTAAEFNSANDEQKNLVTDTGQALSGADVNQFGKSVANYSGGGDFYSDSGAADAYVLSAIGSKQTPHEYYEGMRVRFKPGNTNTGASTVNLNSLGIKDIRDISGTALTGGEIVQDDYLEVVYDTTAGYFRIISSEKSRLPHTLIQTFTTVNDVGDTNQILAGHTIDSDTFLVSSNLIAGYNLNDNTDFSGNSNTLNDADAYNAANGILNVASTAHLGVVGQHLQADNVTGQSGSGDLDISLGGFHNLAVSGGGVSFGTNAADEKIQYYTDANGHVVFDVAAVSRTSPLKVTGRWCAIALVYDSTNSFAYGYINGVCVASFDVTTNLNLQANPSIFINSRANQTLEVASSHDEVFVYEGVLGQYDIDLITASKIAEPSILQGKNYFVKELRQPIGKTALQEQGMTNVVGKINNNLYTQGFQYDRTDIVARYGEVI